MVKKKRIKLECSITVLYLQTAVKSKYEIAPCNMVGNNMANSNAIIASYVAVL
jgi:hypothetical protein